MNIWKLRNRLLSYKTTRKCLNWIILKSQNIKIYKMKLKQCLKEFITEKQLSKVIAWQARKRIAN
jgi:hypothetical protein